MARELPEIPDKLSPSEKRRTLAGLDKYWHKTDGALKRMAFREHLRSLSDRVDRDRIGKAELRNEMKLLRLSAEKYRR